MVELLWTGIFIGIFVLFVWAITTAKKRKLLLWSAVFGMIFGFYFDGISVALGYYTYHPLFFSIIGVPITMTIAEGMSVAVTIRLYQFLKR